HTHRALVSPFRRLQVPRVCGREARISFVPLPGIHRLGMMAALPQMSQCVVCDHAPETVPNDNDAVISAPARVIVKTFQQLDGSGANGASYADIFGPGT